MSDLPWTENNGGQPDYRVDIRLNCDEPDWPRVDCVRYDQDPDDWDWQLQVGGIEITHYKMATN